MSTVSDKLKEILADSYTLYLKTQNYHWHVTGINFKSLHDLFEQQYTELAVAIDDIAERLRTLDEKAPASLQEFEQYRHLKDGDSSLPATKMLEDLHQDHLTVIEHLNEGINLASEQADEDTIALISERLVAHEKMARMLKASI